MQALENLDDISLPSPTDKRPGLESELHDLQVRRRRWMDDYEAGDMTRQEYHERVDPLNRRILKKQKELEDEENALAQSAHTRQVLQELSVAVETIPDYYLNGPKEQVNADLHMILERVIVHKDKSMELVWR